MITFTMNNLYITKIIVRPISNYEQSNSKFENFHNYFRAKQMSLRSFLLKNKNSNYFFPWICNTYLCYRPHLRIKQCSAATTSTLK